MKNLLVALKAFLVVALMGLATPASAATCSTATSAGAAPPSWQTYCWLDFVDYVDATALSAAGQNFSFTLSDGSVLSFNLKATSSAATAMETRVTPSWTGAAIGNNSFLGIPGRPILYLLNSGSTVTLNFTNIEIAPPPGVSAVTEYAFVAADPESTDHAEVLEFTTNGANWELLDTVAPISGSDYPALSGIGTSTMRFDGNNNTGFVGAYIGGSSTPTEVTATMVGHGRQGMMFAVRFASITLNKQISGTRIDASDQFQFDIEATSSGSSFASGTTTGSGNGPFPAAVLTTASGIPLTISEQMAAGSSSALSQYDTRLSCTNNNTGSTTSLPTSLQTSRYDMGGLQFGDSVECVFTNTAFPHLAVQKQMGSGGRIFDTDQFTLSLSEGGGGAILSSTTTSGSGTTITNGSTNLTQVVSGNSYTLDETASGTTVLSRYDASYSCSNANGSSGTILPSGSGTTQSITPVLGDVIICIITNTRGPGIASLHVEKSSRVILDGISASNPKAVPGAVMEYTITVRNEGDLPVDADGIFVVDFLPADAEYSVATNVSFSNGLTASGLNTFNAATMVGFSSLPGGIGPYSYTPSGSFDGNVKGIQVSPEGTMAASDGINHPEFSVSFQIRIM